MNRDRCGEILTISGMCNRVTNHEQSPMASPLLTIWDKMDANDAIRAGVMSACSRKVPRQLPVESLRMCSLGSSHSYVPSEVESECEKVLYRGHRNVW